MNEQIGFLQTLTCQRIDTVRMQADRLDYKRAKTAADLAHLVDERLSGDLCGLELGAGVTCLVNLEAQILDA